jgi:hypothetical protein
MGKASGLIKTNADYQQGSVVFMNILPRPLGMGVAQSLNARPIEVFVVPVASIPALEWPESVMRRVTPRRVSCVSGRWHHAKSSFNFLMMDKRISLSFKAS